MVDYGRTPGTTTSNVVTLDRGMYTACTVNLQGATVTSWRIRNKEMIFVGRKSHYTHLSYIRGGIQFVFPMLELWEFGPDLGFARYMKWTVSQEPEFTEEGDVSAVVTLEHNPYSQSLWRYNFRLYYKIILYEYKLEFYIGVENPCLYYPFEYFIVHHCLMRVPDVTECEIIGFKDCQYKDYLNSKKAVFTDEEDSVMLSAQTDRVYINAPNQILVTNVMHGGRFRIDKRFTKDFNLWNPWREMAKEMSVLDGDEFKKFVAIEAGMIAEPLRLEPLTCWKAYHSFKWIDPKKRKVYQNFLDIFEGYC